MQDPQKEQVRLKSTPKQMSIIHVSMRFQRAFLIQRVYQTRAWSRDDFDTVTSICHLCL